MVAYRLYCLDGGGNIEVADNFEAPGDDEAVAEARQMKNGALKCEVWAGKRLVATLNAQDLAG